MRPSRAILMGDPNHNRYRRSWKMDVKGPGPGKSWKTTFSVLYSPCELTLCMKTWYENTFKNVNLNALTFAVSWCIGHWCIIWADVNFIYMYIVQTQMICKWEIPNKLLYRFSCKVRRWECILLIPLFHSLLYPFPVTPQTQPGSFAETP